MKYFKKIAAGVLAMATFAERFRLRHALPMSRNPLR